MRGPDTKSTNQARSLRKRSTKAETILWYALRDRRLGGFKFTRQEPIGHYYVDFVCRERCLVVEVDGSQHAESEADKLRDKYLAELGYRTIRVWNNDVLGNLEGVLEMLLAELTAAAPHPVPLPASGARVRGSEDDT